MAAIAARAVGDLPHARVITGDSRAKLPGLVDPLLPTLYWLDGHWSGGHTGGREAECPVIAELAATAAGHSSDCVLIDDARLFLAPPPKPHDSEGWPTFMEIFDRLRSDRPGHYVTIRSDVVIAVPQRAKVVVDDFADDNVSSYRSSRILRALASLMPGRA